VFELYPNPAAQYLIIDRELAIPATLNICNTTGQVVLQQKIDKTSHVVNIAELATGLYSVKITTEDGLFVTKKFVKVN